MRPRRDVVGPEADGGEQESQLAERSDVGNNLGGRKTESASVRKDYVLFLSRCNDFNTHGVFGKGQFWAGSFCNCLEAIQSFSSGAAYGIIAEDRGYR